MKEQSKPSLEQAVRNQEKYGYKGKIVPMTVFREFHKLPPCPIEELQVEKEMEIRQAIQRQKDAWEK